MPVTAEFGQIFDETQRLRHVIIVGVKQKNVGFVSMAIHLINVFRKRQNIDVGILQSAFDRFVEDVLLSRDVDDIHCDPSPRLSTRKRERSGMYAR